MHSLHSTIKLVAYIAISLGLVIGLLSVRHFFIQEIPEEGQLESPSSPTASTSPDANESENAEWRVGLAEVDKENVESNQPIDVRGSIYAPPGDRSFPISRYAGIYTIWALREHFDRHYQSALQGDPASMYEMSVLALNCQKVMGFNSIQEYVDDRRARITSSTLYEDFILRELPFIEHLFPDCVYINSHMPIGRNEEIRRELVDYHLAPDASSSNHWLAQAAAAGFPLAKLRMHTSLNPIEESVHEELVDEAIRTRHPDAMYYVYQMVAVRVAERFIREGKPIEYTGIESPTIEVWRYLHCVYHAGCDVAKRIQYLESRYLSSDVEGILKAAARFEKRILDPNPIRVDRDVDELFVSGD